ncbi:MAG: hypothetical protein ACE5IH_10500 [Thermodesulfobacteriota bacterium]
MTKDNMDILKGEVSINGFNLEYNTPIFRHPERFGIKRVIQNENLDFNICFDYEVTNGLTQAQTWKLVDKFNKELGLDYIGTRFISELLGRTAGR